MAKTVLKPDKRAEAAPALRLFDCYAWMGTATRPPLSPALTPSDLLAEMDRCGVDEALVHSAALDISSPTVTNAELSTACAPHQRLHPVWNLLPPQTGEMEPKSLFASMRKAGVKTLAAYPDENRYLLNGLTMGRTFKGLVERRIPLFLRGGGTNWARIADVLKEFPRLIVVACEYGCWGQDRYIRPLLERFTGFHIETSTLELHGGIPALVEKYGADRILFGSSFHRRPMGGPSLLLRNLDISMKAKEQIGHGNLERLLKEAKP